MNGQGLTQAGAGVDVLPLARKPNVAEAPAPGAPFHDRFFTVTAGPLVVSVPFQSWDPPGHELTVRYAAVRLRPRRRPR